MKSIVIKVKKPKARVVWGYTATKKLDSSLRGDLPKWYN